MDLHGIRGKVWAIGLIAAASCCAAAQPAWANRWVKAYTKTPFTGPVCTTMYVSGGGWGLTRNVVKVVVTLPPGYGPSWTNEVSVPHGTFSFTKKFGYQGSCIPNGRIDIGVTVNATGLSGNTAGYDAEFSGGCVIDWSKC
jgi:hypothetical protein